MKGDQYEVHETLTTPSSSSQRNSNATTNVNRTANLDNETKATSIETPTITEKALFQTLFTVLKICPEQTSKRGLKIQNIQFQH